MKTLKDAIEIILGEPPEAHYPSYYASLLRKADVPDKNVGDCSEIPNSSEIIRCKDCKKAPKCYGDVLMRSKGGGLIYYPLEYCSEAERREGASKQEG